MWVRPSFKVLGVDTSLRSTGFGVVQAQGSVLRPVEYGRIRNPATRSHSECLRTLHEDLRALIERTQPDAVAIEGIFFCKNVRTAVTLGQARGAVIAVCALAGLPIFEYSPRKVKQALSGSGAGSKQQVSRMVQQILTLEDTPQEDAGDALAIAICHLHHRSSVAALAPTPL